MLKNSSDSFQGDVDEEGARAAAGHVDAHLLRVLRPRPHGPEHGEQADGDGELQLHDDNDGHHQLLITSGFHNFSPRYWKR